MERLKKILKSLNETGKFIMVGYKRASNQLNVPTRDSNKHSLKLSLEVLIRSGKSQSKTQWYLNRLKCDLLIEMLIWVMEKVKTEAVVGEPLCQELCRIVGRVGSLINDCHQARWDNQPKLVTVSHTREAFEPLILSLVWWTTITKAVHYQWSDATIEEHTREEYEANWKPKLLEATHQDQMSWFAKVKQLPTQPSKSDVPMYVQQWLLSKDDGTRGLKDEAHRTERSSIMYMNATDIELIEAIGQGAFGRVYKVQWLKEWCAFKEFEGAENESFQAEARVLATLCHPHIVQFIGCLMEENRCSFVMEILDHDLTFYLRKMGMTMDLVVAIDIMLQVAEGMKYLHDKGIVHRDLKATNILVKYLKGHKKSMFVSYVVKISDFGLAKTKFNSMETLRTHNVGTPQWTAPELFKTLFMEEGSTTEQHKHVFPKKADVYSFGIVCFEILSGGKIPYGGLQKPVRSLRQEILDGLRPVLPNTCPQFLASFIQDCWDIDPEKRPTFDSICITLKRFKTTLLTVSELSNSQEGDSSGSHVPAKGPSSPRPGRPKGAVLFTLQELAKATNSFAKSQEIGEGGFGMVYRGKLMDGTAVAIKRVPFEARSFEEFEATVDMLSQVEHLNLVRLIGYCKGEQHEQNFLVTEYVSNGNLRQHLDGAPYGIKLDMSKRLDIAIDVANGLSYLHSDAGIGIIHRDVKSSNILITDSFQGKITNFGYARAGPSGGATHVSTQVRGTAGYLDPEYMTSYQLTKKSDVYSYGILLVEIFTGRRPIELKRPSDERVTERWASEKLTEGRLDLILDPNIEMTPAVMGILWVLFEVTFSCLARHQNRPSMKEAQELLWNIRNDYKAALNQQ